MKGKFENSTIVDVRTPEEFSKEHYPGAINIPLGEVTQRVKEFKEMKQPIVAYCRSGNRSGQAVAILKQAGIEDISNGGALKDMLQQG